MLAAQSAVSSSFLNSSPSLVNSSLLAEEASLQNLTEEQAPSNPTSPSPTPTFASNTFSVLKNLTALDPALLSEANPTSTGGATSPTPSSTSTGNTTLSGITNQIGSLSGQLQSAISSLQGLNPSTDPNYLQDSTNAMLNIQNLQNQIQELTTLASDELSQQHQDAMAILNNIGK